MVDPSKNSRNELTKALGVISGPLSDYWYGLSRWNRLDELATFIRSLQPISADLIKYVLGATFVTAAIARIIGYDEGSLEFVDTPIVNEIIGVCFFLIAGFITSVMFHKPLRLIGGKGEFRHTFLSATYVAVTFLPFVILAEGIYLLVTGQQLPTSAYTVAQLMYLTMLLGKIHELPYGKAYAVIFGITLALSVVVVVAMVLLLTPEQGATVRSTDGKSRVRLPRGWSTKLDLHDEAQLQVGDTQQNAYFIVLTESKLDFGDQITYRDHARMTLNELVKGIDAARIVRGPTDLFIGGRPGVQYEVHGTAENLGIVYLHSTVDGHDSFHQLLAWTVRSGLEANRKTLEDVINSFTETK